MLTVENSGALVAPVTSKGKTMKVEITRGTIVEGERVNAGGVVDVPDHVANTLIASGKAQEATEKPKAKRGRKPKSDD